MNTDHDASEDFAYLIFGLKSYFDKNCREIPLTLRHAMNELAFRKKTAFPKTMQQFLQDCRKPLDEWYSNPIPNFNSSQPVLYEKALSEEAREYYLNLLDEWEVSTATEVNQDILDNAKMKAFRRELQAMPEQDKAQAIYSAVRSFLIEHSWVQLDDLRAEYAIFNYLRDFYEEMPLVPLKELKVCPRCGLLHWQNESWQGIKASYCNEHGVNVKLQSIPNKGQLYRLKPIIHERVFLPGQIEKALFNLAESLVDGLYLLETERYSGIDAYDLRLSFADGESWAIDAKDQAKPKRLAHDIRMPFAEGRLAYSHAIYVIPDERMDERDYRESLAHNRQFYAPNLDVLSFSEFKERLETKLKKLAKSLRKSKKD